jgi:hypothetical protein
MNGSVMMHAVGKDFADRWRKISEEVCVCVCICWYMQWVRVRTCLYNGVSVYYVYIYLYTRGGERENGAEKGRASHREKQQQQQQQQAVGLFIKHEKVTGLSKRNVTKYESLSSSSSPYFILFHPDIDAGNQCQSPLRLVAIRILRMYSVHGLSGSMIIIRSKIFVSYYEIGVLIRMCPSLRSGYNPLYRMLKSSGSIPCPFNIFCAICVSLCLFCSFMFQYTVKNCITFKRLNLLLNSLPDLLVILLL